MLTEAALLLALLRLVHGLIGRLELRLVAAGPAFAGAGMAITIVILPGHWVLDGVVGGLVYVVLLGAVERALHPADFMFMRKLVSRGRPAG